MRRVDKAIVVLCAFNVLLWSYLAVGLMAWGLQSRELHVHAVYSSMRRATEEGHDIQPLTRDVFWVIVDRYGVTNSGYILNEVEVETLAGFLEAARGTGTIYVGGGVLYAMGREDLVAYSPVIRGRLWPYTVEWVNQ